VNPDDIGKGDEAAKSLRDRLMDFLSKPVPCRVYLASRKAQKDSGEPQTQTET
jgi:hypothetical protein